MIPGLEISFAELLVQLCHVKFQDANGLDMSPMITLDVPSQFLDLLTHHRAIIVVLCSPLEAAF